MEISKAIDTKTQDKMKKNQKNREVLKIELPVHFINQMRRVKGEIEGKEMDIIEHKHETNESFKDAIKQNTGVIFVNAEEYQEEFPNLKVKADDEKTNNVLRIINFKKIEKLPEGKSLCF